MIAKETGWTLEYIESLSVGQLWEYLSIKDADDKAAASWRSRQRMEAAARPKPKGFLGRRRR